MLYTHVTITVVADGLSSIARLLSENRIISYEKGPAPLMTLTFDNGGQGKSVDVRPTLPMVLRY